MAAAQGFMTGGGKSFGGGYLIDGVQYIVVGTLNQEVPQFVCTDTTLACDGVETLTGEPVPFTGNIGGALFLQVSDSYMIVGGLESPLDLETVDISGTWRWTRSAFVANA